MLSIAINLLHWSIIFFVVAGWLAPWKLVLLAHAFFIPAMVLHWRTNENRCFLTELEEKLKARDEEARFAVTPAMSQINAGATADSATSVEEGGFIKSAWKAIFGTVPSDHTLMILIYGIIGLAWTLSALRLATAD